MLNPVRQITPPMMNRSRQRRATDGELARLMACAHTRSFWLAAMIQMAVETGMRRSELLSMLWDDVDVSARTIYLAHSKNGHPRTVPLSSAAVRTLETIPRIEARVFPITANAFRLAWERLRARAGVTGLRFHDLRHEAVSRFFEKGLSLPRSGIHQRTPATQEC